MLVANTGIGLKIASFFVQNNERLTNLYEKQENNGKIIDKSFFQCYNFNCTLYVLESFSPHNSDYVVFSF